MLPPAKDTSAHNCLNALRGIAALLVAFQHSRLLLIKQPSEATHVGAAQKLFYFLTSLGPSAVIVFFVLSGFLVGSSVIRDIRSGRWSWKEYALARVSRIYVVLVPALVIGAAIDLYGCHFFAHSSAYSVPHYGYMLPESIPADISLSIFVGNLLALQDSLVPTLGSNHPLWSLANEIWYYVIFPLVALAFGGRRKALYGLSAFCVFAALPQGIRTLFGIWLMGVGLTFLPSKNVSGGAVALAAIALIIWLAVQSLKILTSDFTTGALTTALIYCLLNRPHLSIPPLLARAADAAAEMSYSLYLMHTPLLVLIAAIVVGQGQRLEPYALGMATTLGALAVVVAYSHAVWFVFERRTPEVRRWLKRVAG